MSSYFKPITKWVAILMLIFVASCGTVETGEQGYYSVYGKIKPTPVTEGFHWFGPAVDLITVDIRERRMSVEKALAASKDLQSVNIDVVSNYRVNPAKSYALISQVSKNADTKYIESIILRPAVEEAIKASTAKFTAEELVTKRAELKDAIKVYLVDLLAERGGSGGYFLINDISITNVEYTSAEFNAQIEAKVTAAQHTLQLEQELKSAQIEADKTVLQAKAQAEVLRLQREQTTEITLKLRQLEIQQAFVNKWNGVFPQYMFGNSNLMNTLPLPQPAQK